MGREGRTEHRERLLMKSKWRKITIMRNVYRWRTGWKTRGGENCKVTNSPTRRSYFPSNIFNIA